MVNVDHGGWSQTYTYKGQQTTFRSQFSIGGIPERTPIEIIDDTLTANIDGKTISLVKFEGLKNPFCKSAHSGGDFSILCSGIIHPSRQAQIISVVPVSPSVTLSPPETSVIRATRNAPFAPEKLITLFLILLATAPIFWILHSSLRVSQWAIVTLAVSILLWLQPIFSALLLTLIGAYYPIGQAYAKQKPKATWKILSWLIFTIIVLLIFKNFKALFFLPFDQYGVFALVLPLGTSYFLIRLLDLQLRWHRGQLGDLSFREYLAYVLFPPTIVAGPIELIDGFRDNRLKKIELQDISYGLMRVSIGVTKKLIIVDLLLASMLFQSGLWDRVIQDPAGSGTDVLLFCLLSYLFAYLDFSAYSDIAIGLSRLFGYRIIENFNWPILARNLNEFWKRWHISLSGWCFRNIFFPVLIMTKSQTLALIVTLLAVGLWHDLAPSWMTWGLYHGIGLSLVGVLAKKLKFWKKIPKVAGVIGTNVFVAAGFAFVTISDYGLAWTVFGNVWRQIILLPYTVIMAIIS